MSDGTRFLPPSDEVQARRVRESDRPGEHLWIVTAAWRIPEPGTGPARVLLDGENLLAMSAAGCFKCEREHTPQLAAQPCTGSTGVG